eukprot:scaffold615147_cov36-Prasinocladus_malaysianus.AAC.1
MRAALAHDPLQSVLGEKKTNSTTFRSTNVKWKLSIAKASDVLALCFIGLCDGARHDVLGCD